MRSFLRAGLASALVISVVVSAAVTAAAAATVAPALADPGAPTQPGSAYAGSTLRSHHSPATTGTLNTHALSAIVNGPSRVLGVDVASYQDGIDWTSQWRQGVRFAYVKATEYTNYQNPSFFREYDGSRNVGMVRGAYHFAHPNASAVAQADYFANYLTWYNRAWQPDGFTLPPALDIEYQPNGPACWGVSQPAMVSWLRAFSSEVHKRLHRYPVIYTTTDWWQQCTGNSSALATTDRLWIANWSGSPGVLPAGWQSWKFWQFQEGDARSPNTPDRNVFNGSRQQLQAFARSKG